VSGNSLQTSGEWFYLGDVVNGIAKGYGMKLGLEKSLYIG